MNNPRRKKIEETLENLAILREMIETIMEEEQEAYDNLPESLQEGTRGCAMQDAIDALDGALCSCDEIEEYLDTAKE